ncbi:MAG: hypothetical protein ACI9VM_000852 [Candidatus Azotimanducaceae bacterium]|jgi:hypothetical protein
MSLVKTEIKKKHTRISRLLSTFSYWSSTDFTQFKFRKSRNYVVVTMIFLARRSAYEPS